MRGVLTPAIELCVFESPGGLQLPTFGSVSFILTLIPKWGCEKKPCLALEYTLMSFHCDFRFIHVLS
jgi:hypothetical protein